MLKEGTYHCRVAGVEWGLDALLFSFSSSVKGKKEKKKLTSVGNRRKKNQRLLNNSEFQKTRSPSDADALKQWRLGSPISLASSNTSTENTRRTYFFLQTRSNCVALVTRKTWNLLCRPG